jgi:hypothetical protein
VIREDRYGRKELLLPDVIESSVSERYEVLPKEIPQSTLIQNNVTE